MLKAKMPKFLIFRNWNNFIDLAMQFVNTSGEIFFVLNFRMIKVNQDYLLSNEYRNLFILGLNVGGKVGSLGLFVLIFSDNFWFLY